MIIMESTHSTPEVDLEGSTLTIKGICTPENPTEFFNLFKEQLDIVLTSTSEYHLIFHLEYFNTTSSKCLLDLFKKVKISPNRPNIKVTWIYDSDDEEILEAGELFSELSGINFLYKHAD